MKVKVIKEAKSKNELKDRAKKHKKANKKKAWGWFVNPNAGNVEYNVDFFNHAMGSDGGTLGTSGGASDGGGMGESLQEAISNNVKIYEVEKDGLPEVGRKFIAYRTTHKEYEIYTRQDKEDIRKQGWSDVDSHISKDGEFYSGKSGWIYPVDYDRYVYLDELKLISPKTTKQDQLKQENVTKEIKTAFNEVFGTFGDKLATAFTIKNEKGDVEVEFPFSVWNNTLDINYLAFENERKINRLLIEPMKSNNLNDTDIEKIFNIIFSHKWENYYVRKELAKYKQTALDTITKSNSAEVKESLQKEEDDAKKRETVLKRAGNLTEQDLNHTEIEPITESTLINSEYVKEYYNRKWKPSKTAKREFAQKMNSIEDFCKENNISHSKTSDSYYFEIDGQKYRVSNHSVEASNYNSGGRYHNDGRRDDTIYIHAGKTRVMDIFNDLKVGKKLDSRGNVITEDIEKHDTLNPKIWNSDNTLKKEVKEKIDEIVDTFKENLLEDGVDLKIKDVIICGSNANYNYTENSDIDVHIISDTKDLDCNKKHLPIIYNAYKKMFNDSYGIEFYDTEVEIYVENDKTGVTSGGIYSVKDDKWLKEPSMVEVPEVDEKEFEEELSKWEDECNEILYNLEDIEDSIRNIDTLLDELYEMRQDSIQKEGEFSIGNLVFKELRNKGFLTNLKGVKKELQSRLMSLYDNE